MAALLLTVEQCSQPTLSTFSTTLAIKCRASVMLSEHFTNRATFLDVVSVFALWNKRSFYMSHTVLYNKGPSVKHDFSGLSKMSLWPGEDLSGMV